MSAPMPPESDLFLSVIIPVYNDFEGLRDTLESLNTQDVGDDAFEVIVADNGSTDGTWRKAKQYAHKSQQQITVVQEKQIQSSYAARNRGIEEARGDVFCFLDADMVAPYDYIRQVSQRFTETDVDYLAADVFITTDSSSLTSIYNSVTGFPVARYLERGHYAPTCCLSVRRDVVESLGNFDSRLESGGDMEFGQRVHAAGLVQAFAPDVTLHHPPRRTFASLMNKQKRIGRGHAQLTFYYPARYSLLAQLYVKTTRYFLPGNPASIHTQCQQRELDVDFPTAFAISTLQIPLAWAGLLAYLNETRRLLLQNER